jgi:hypothetical protein
MTLGEFLGLYMTSKRKQAFISLAMSDIVFDKMPGVRDHEQRLAGLKMQYEGLTEVQIEAAMRGMGNALIAEIGAQYEKIADDDIRAFVAAVERFFNETSTSEKTETDLLLYGYTNVLGGYYYPLERDKNAFDVNLIGNDRIIGNMIGVTGRMATPLSMVIMGMRLGTMKMSALFKDIKVYITVAVKMLVMPLIAFAFVYFLPISSGMKMVFYIVSACPSASVVLNFSELVGEGQKEAASMVLSSTILSVITMPVMMLLLPLLG